MAKDKEKVIDEVWTEDHVRSFLNIRSSDGTDNDFHALLKAYRSMRPSDFKLFIAMFKEADRNLDATDKQGRNVLSIVSEHRHGKEYAETLRIAGAQ
ncbi:MAG: PA4642 family protein [Parahaliea sp.]